MADQPTGDPRAQFLGFDTARTSKVQAPAAGRQELEANISLIKDIAPGYGDGFIEACLLACKGDAQQAANMLLENRFPESLQGLDRQLARAPERSSDRIATETGDPRAAWMGPPLEGHATGDTTTAPLESKHGATESHISPGISATGDPRASWLGTDTTAPQAGAHGTISTKEDTAAKDAEGMYFKTGDPRAQ